MGGSGAPASICSWLFCCPASRLQLFFPPLVTSELSIVGSMIPPLRDFSLPANFFFLVWLTAPPRGVFVSVVSHPLRMKGDGKRPVSPPLPDDLAATTPLLITLKSVFRRHRIFFFSPSRQPSRFVGSAFFGDAAF